MKRLGQSVPNRDLGAAHPEHFQDESVFHSEAFSHEASNRGTAQRLDYSGIDIHADIPGIDAMFQQNLSNESWDNSWVDTMLNGQGLMDDSLFGLFTSGQPFI
jgi:hypothetical protein